MANIQNTYTPYTPYEATTSDLRSVLMRYLRYWKWFVLSLVVALVGAYVYLLFQQPIYKVQASLLIKDEKKGISEDNILKEMDIFAPKKVVENEIEVLKSYTLMERVVDRLGLDIQYFRPTPTGDREIYDKAPIRLVIEKAAPLLYKERLKISFEGPKTVTINEQRFPVNQSVQTPYGRLRIFTRQLLSDTTNDLNIQVLQKSEAVRGYLERLKVEPTSKASTVLAMTLEDAVPAKGEAILNQLLDEYNQAAVLDKNKVASNTLEFIEDRLELIAGELATVEKDVESFKSSQGITELGAQATVFLQQAQQNDTQLNQVNIQLGALSDVERYLRSQPGQKAVAPAMLGLNDPVLLGLISKVTELELKRDQMVRTTSENNPLLQTIDSQITATKSNISDNVQTMKEMLTTTRNKLVATNGKIESMIRTVPYKERELLNITRQQAIKNNLYTYLLQKREETALSYAATVADSRTIDPARSGQDPIKPVRKLIFLLFAAFGLLLPVGVLAARDALNDRVLRRTDVEELTQVPILGEVIENQNPAEALVVSSRSRTVIAEQIRALRTNLQFLRSNPDNSQVLLFTSSISGEGKSFMSMNLGASLAMVDRPTVILEMDLRKPKLHSALNVPNTVGISNYLIGQAEIDEILQPVPGVPNYFIITSGPIPPNPAELLTGDRLPQLINSLKDRFSFVLVDSPPIGLVTDAQLIAPHADATLYVVRHDVTPKNYLRMIDSLYREQRFNKLNIILNAVENGQTYYSYSYSYYGYGNEESSTKAKVKRLAKKA